MTEPTRPEKFADALRETAFYLDILDQVLERMNVTTMDGTPLVSTGDQMQIDMRRLADRLADRPNLDEYLMDLMTEGDLEAADRDLADFTGPQP